MIYTLTLNPAVDRELQVADIQFNSVLRATAWRVDAGGKGFNVSRMLQVLGERSVAVAFLAGHAGTYLSESLQSMGIDVEAVWVPGETRTNVSIVQAGDGRYIKVNEPGPTISPEAQAAMLEKIRSLAQAGDWWVLSGSLPPGVPADFYATILTMLKEAGAYSVLDTSGAPLRLAYQAAPFLIKPNREEAAELFGVPVETRDDLLEVARRFLASHVRYAAISLGEDGALLATPEGTWWGQAPEIEARNPIGAGDAMIAGMVWALGQQWPPEDVLRAGMACGAATASQAGTGMGTLDQVQALMSHVKVARIA
ncbi:MAG: 1-phosphofructokinase [Ardenticatenia bacterium]|nr:MAG: 1-phosphofructokinase [Ardenticatenia bacterium]